MRFDLRCPVYPTEDETLVCNAIINILGKLSLTVHQEDLQKMVVSEFLPLEFLERLRERVHELGVVNTAITRLTSNWTGDLTAIHLDKQAACVKRLRIVDDSEEDPPLGTIQLSLKFDTPQEFDNFLLWFSQRPDKTTTPVH